MHDRRIHCLYKLGEKIDVTKAYREPTAKVLRTLNWKVPWSNQFT